MDELFGGQSLVSDKIVELFFVDLTVAQHDYPLFHLCRVVPDEGLR
jgi:hypothetical protein